MKKEKQKGGTSSAGHADRYPFPSNAYLVDAQALDGEIEETDQSFLNSDVSSMSGLVASNGWRGWWTWRVLD